MCISPIISFTINFIIYASFDKDLSQDLSARGTSCPSPLCPVDQIQVQKPTFELLPQIRCLITLRIESSIISIDSNITDKSSGRSLIYSRKSVGPRMEP